MDLELSESDYRSLTIVFAGVVIGSYLVGIPVLFYISLGLSTADQALVMASALSSVGTLALALATFVTISQSSERLKIQQKKQEQPLAKDELSHVIQPAIDALEANLRKFTESDNPGCVFEWVYISGASLYSPGRGPVSIQVRSLIPAGRLAGEDQDLYDTLMAHDRYSKRIAGRAKRLHMELEPEIERLFEEEGVTGESTKAVTTAVLKELEAWGEDEVLTKFWEENGDWLIQYAQEETEVTLSEVKSMEESYQEYMQNTLRALFERKAELMREYSISEDDIMVETEEFRDAI